MSKKKLIIASLIGTLFCYQNLFCQEENESSSLFYNQQFETEVRGANVFTVSGGSSVMNGDLVDPMFDIYFHAGFKRYLSANLNINLTYHKFNLVYKDTFNNGFMSFDLNFEYDFFPASSVNLFIFAGGGLNAANYFERTDPKIQGGGGLEFLVSPKLGIKVFTDYNQLFTDQLDGVVRGDADDVYWRMGLGLNWYFGRHLGSQRIAKNTPTVIKSNPVVEDY